MLAAAVLLFTPEGDALHHSYPVYVVVSVVVVIVMNPDNLPVQLF